MCFKGVAHRVDSSSDIWCKLVSFEKFLLNVIKQNIQQGEYSFSTIRKT